MASADLPNPNDSGRLVREMLGTSGKVVLTVERIEKDWREPRAGGGRWPSAVGPVYDVAWCRRSDNGALIPLPVDRLHDYEVLNEH